MCRPRGILPVRRTEAYASKSEWEEEKRPSDARHTLTCLHVVHDLTRPLGLAIPLVVSAIVGFFVVPFKAEDWR